MFIAKAGELYIPTPRDLVREKEDQDGRLFTISLAKKNDIQCYSGYPFDLIPYEERDLVSIPESLISFGEVHQTKRIKSFEFDHFAKNEPKVGVGLDRNTRAGKEGRLFRVGLTRFQYSYHQNDMEIDETYFVICYQGLEGFQTNLVKLGAEGKVARVERTAPIRWPQLKEEAKQSKYFKVILLTPAIFRNGNSPKLENLLLGIEVESMLSFVGKSKAIGGWDMLNNRPKEMSKAVPAGSVYYYEIKSNHTFKDVEIAFGKVISLSEGSEEQRKAGFGLFYLSTWNLEVK